MPHLNLRMKSRASSACVRLSRGIFRAIAWRALLVFPAVAAVAAVEAPSKPVPAVRILSEELSIPGVCAWPKLTLLPDGTIAVAIYNQPGHVQLLEGDVACWASTDGGVTWQLRGNATQHQPGTARFNHAIGSNAAGDIFVAAGGWSLVPNEDGKTFKRGELQRPVVSRSADGGKNWRVSTAFPDGQDGQRLVPFGNIVPGADGNLRVAAYSFSHGRKPRVDTCYSVISRDGGITWAIQSVIGTPAANETDLLHLGGGRWLAAARNLGDPGASGHSIDLYASEDDAGTWTKGARVTEPLEHPGDLLKLADGRIVLAYGDRRPGHHGVAIKVSGDQGRSWSAPVAITRGVQTRDTGYPSTVQLADGTLVTAYYTKKSTRLDGYHMAVVRWRLEK